MGSKSIGSLFSSTLLGLVAISSTAWAQPDIPNEAYSAPTFVTLDRVGPRTGVSTSLSMSTFDGTDPNVNLRVDLYAQFVNHEGFGGYATMPFSIVKIGDDIDTETGVGHLQLGGFYRLGDKAAPFFARVGLFLPAATGENAAINILTAAGRYTDILGTFPETTSLRLSGSHLRRQGQLFLRGDLGVDIVIDSPEGFDIDPLLRLNLGAGFDTPNYAATLEFATIASTMSDIDDRFAHTIALSAQLKTHTIDPFFAIVLPVGADGDSVNAVGMLGIQMGYR